MKLQVLLKVKQMYITGLEHDLQYLLIKVSSDSLFTVGSPAMQCVVPQSNVISEELSDVSKKKF